MSSFLDSIRARVLVADGATGTNLQQVGLEAGGHSEEWVFKRPERIVELEEAFVTAGADLILTCTFGATSVRMKGSQYASRIGELNREAARLAREAGSKGTSVIVAGSMGPLGKLLKPFGPLSHAEAVAAYAEQVEGLVSGKVDLFAIETQFSMDEARAALDAVRSVCDLPVVVSFSYDRGTRTMMGVKPREAAVAFAELGASMIGLNCGTSLDNALLVLQEYGTATPPLPVWVKPNAGMPRLEGSRTIYDVTPEQMGEFARAAVRLGARVVGGCCGTTPLHVAAITAAVVASRDNH